MHLLIFVFKFDDLGRNAEASWIRASTELLYWLWIVIFIVHKRVDKNIHSIFADDNQSRSFLIKLELTNRPWNRFDDYTLGQAILEIKYSET